MTFDLTNLEINLGLSEDENRLVINKDLYVLEPLYPGAETGKGGNSCVYAARPDLPEQSPLVVKFCRFPIEPKDENYETRIKRFRQEIRALAKAKNSEYSDCFIKFVAAGELSLEAVENGRSGSTVKVIYYVMEQADRDLERLLAEETLSISERIALMERLLFCVSATHKLGYRHRDLKPDNVFIVNGLLKVGDLGLIDRVHQSYGLDSTREKIGPSGYLSPEAINKAFGNHGQISDAARIEISEESDIYQLGLIFFYILQGEIPVGRLAYEDLEYAEIDCKRWQESLFYPMMSFRKNLRPSVEKVAELLTELR